MSLQRIVDLVQSSSVLVAGSSTARSRVRVYNSNATTPVLITIGRQAYAADADEVQKIAFSATPNAGGFKLDFDEYGTTATIAYGANAGTIQAAIRLLPGLEAITVSGSITATGVSVTFVGVFPAPRMSVVESTLVVNRIDSVHTVTFADVPFIGTFKFKFRKTDGTNHIYETAQIPYDASVGTIQQYVRDATGDFLATVTGSFTGGLVITYKLLSGQIALVEVIGNSLKGSVEEIQDITFSGTPGRGTFKLKYKNHETSALAHDVASAAVQTALRLLPGLEQITVTGSVGAGFVVTFFGEPGDRPLIEVVSNSVDEDDAVYEIQNLAFYNTPTAGSFKIKIGALTTTALAFDCLDSDIQAAIVALSDTYADVTVTGDWGSQEFDVEFIGVEAGVAAIEVVENTLTIWQEQTLSIEQGPPFTAGSFTLSYGEGTTDAIPYNASAGDVQDALRELEGLEDVTVAVVADQYVVTMVGVADPDLLVIVGTDLEPAQIDQVLHVQKVGGDTISSGTWKLTYDGNSTTAMAYDIIAADAQTALRLLAGLSSVVVTGTNISLGFDIAFVGMENPELLTLTDVTFIDEFDTPITAAVTEDTAFEQDVEIVESAAYEAVLVDVTDNDTAFVAATVTEITVTEDTAGGASASLLTPTIVETTPGSATADVTGTWSLTTPGTNAAWGQVVAAGETLDLDECKLSVYAKSNGTSQVLSVIEDF